MKRTDKKKPVHTIPDGVWESSKSAKDSQTNAVTTDEQEDGYPEQTQSK
ncbi:MAG: hypothetical protein IJ801_05515 [Lachnospiraceae bacterium]|nr:hypothetical protein [Lachnospiraceae bacterium]